MVLPGVVLAPAGREYQELLRSTFTISSWLGARYADPGHLRTGICAKMAGTPKAGAHP
jgi:hypothetical protein